MCASTLKRQRREHPSSDPGQHARFPRTPNQKQLPPFVCCGGTMVSTCITNCSLASGSAVSSPTVNVVAARDVASSPKLLAHGHVPPRADPWSFQIRQPRRRTTCPATAAATPRPTTAHLRPPLYRGRRRRAESGEKGDKKISPPRFWARIF